MAKVAIIDTGIADQQVPRTDGLLAGIRRTPQNIDSLTSFPIGDPDTDTYLDFDAGHGTFVAGIVSQVAPDAAISVYRAIDSDGIGSEVAVAGRDDRGGEGGQPDHQSLPRLPDAR